METAIKNLHNTIKAKLQTRSTEHLILDANVARANRADEMRRLVFALIMDELQTRLPEAEFETLYEAFDAM
jgi:hypothetical protein